MENKLFLDQFDTRFKASETGVTFSVPGTHHMEFSEKEKLYFISKIINGLFIHKCVTIRIPSIFEITSLFGLKDTYTLIKSGAIEVIDDHGMTIEQKISIRENFKPTKNSYGDIDMVRFGAFLKPNNSFEIEKIEENLTKKYNGSFENKFTKQLINELDEQKIQFDPSPLSLLINQECQNDIESKYINSQIHHNTKSVQDYHFLDIVHTNKILSLNRSLAYQLEFNIKSLYTDSFGQSILTNKLSPIYQSKIPVSESDIFEKIKQLKKIPDIARLYMNSEIEMEEIIKLSRNYHAEKFKKLLIENEGNELSVLQEIAKEEPKIGKLIKLIRWTIPELIQIKIPIPGLAKGIKLLDSLFLDKVYRKEWHPNFYLDDSLLKPLLKKDKKLNKKLRKEKFEKRFGKVGRNKICPCGSEKKYKYCHGK